MNMWLEWWRRLPIRPAKQTPEPALCDKDWCPCDVDLEDD